MGATSRRSDLYRGRCGSARDSRTQNVFRSVQNAGHNNPKERRGRSSMNAAPDVRAASPGTLASLKTTGQRRVIFEPPRLHEQVGDSSCEPWAFAILTCSGVLNPPALTNQNLGFESDRRRERRGHEAGLLALFENAKCPVSVRTRGEPQARPKHNLSESRCPIAAVYLSLPRQFQRQEFELRSRATELSVNRKQVSTAARSRCSGLHASPGPSKSIGGAV